MKQALPENVDPNVVDIWFQDETRIGQQGSTTRLWATKGSRPKALKQQQFLYGYLYGAVCPSLGIASGLALPYANKECMKKHIEDISSMVPDGRHAILVVDGAGWHTKDCNCHNVTLLQLPPYSPELNPCEQIWAYLKEIFLSNRVFNSYDAIINATCDAWMKFANDENLIRSMCTRDWAVIH